MLENLRIPRQSNNNYFAAFRWFMGRYIRLRKLDEQGKPAKEEEASDLIKDPRIQEAYLGKK